MNSATLSASSMSSLGLLGHHQTRKSPFQSTIADSDKLKTLIKDVEAQVAELDGDTVIVYGKLADKKSIMMYPLASQNIDWNTKLSDEDKKYANKSYPKLN